MGFHAANPMPDGTTSEPTISLSITNQNDEMGCDLQEAVKRRAEPEHGYNRQNAASRTGGFLPRISGHPPNEVVDAGIISAERLDRLSLCDSVTGHPVAKASSTIDVNARHRNPQAELDRVRRRSVSPSPSVASSHCSAVSQAAFSNPRQRFLLFIKILFKCLTQANEPEVLKQAKKIVAECTRRNRQGDPKFTPLMEAVEKRLRGFVGENHWRRSVLLLRHFLIKTNGAEPDETQSG